MLRAERTGGIGGNRINPMQRWQLAQKLNQNRLYSSDSLGYQLSDVKSLRAYS